MGAAAAAATWVALAALVAVTVTALAAWARARAAQRTAEREAVRWQSLAQRRAREARWRGLADNAGSSVVCLDRHRVLGANLRAAQELARGETARLVGSDFMTFVSTADRGRLGECLDDRVAQGGGTSALMARLTTADGRTFAAELTASVARELDQVVTYLSWHEAPLRRRAEAVVEALGTATSLMLVVTDGAGNLIWANSALFQRTGYEFRRFQGKPLWPLLEGTRRPLVVALSRARRRLATTGVVEVRCADGEVIRGEFSAAPLRSLTGQTEVLFAGTELGRIGGRGRELLVSAGDRALSQLGTYLAHKVGNDFQALVGLLQGVTGGEPGAERLAVAQRLAAGAVDDLRRFVRVARAASGVVRPLRLWPLLERWREQAAPGIPPAVRFTLRREAAEDGVMADGGQLVLWLEVSLAAALVTMPLGGALEVSLREGAAPGTVRLAFADTGQEAALAEGAEEGEQFFSRRTAQALAELIAHRHGARAGTSHPGRIGGRNWIEFPVRAASPPEQALASRRPGAVLVADDEELVRATLVAALRGAGYEVEEARNGLEAVEKVTAAADRFALVILDLVMPVMDGREALRRLRAVAPELPVLLCTGYDPMGDQGLTATALLIKPFGITEFVAKAAELCGAGDGRAPVVP